MSVRVQPVNGHYEAYLNGNFVVSGDTHAEVLKELEELEQEGE